MFSADLSGAAAFINTLPQSKVREQVVDMTSLGRFLLELAQTCS